MSDHKTTLMKYPFNNEIIPIDNKIINLLEYIWSCGLQTGGSCEEIEPNWCWIKFSNIMDAREFVENILNILRKKYPNVLAIQHPEDYLCPRALGMTAKHTNTPPWKFMFPLCGGMSVWIPHKDVSRIESLIRGDKIGK